MKPCRLVEIFPRLMGIYLIYTEHGSKLMQQTFIVTNKESKPVSKL